MHLNVVCNRVRVQSPSGTPPQKYLQSTPSSGYSVANIKRPFTLIVRRGEVNSVQTSNFYELGTNLIHRTEKDGGCTFYHNTLRT